MGWKVAVYTNPPSIRVRYRWGRTTTYFRNFHRYLRRDGKNISQYATSLTALPWSLEFRKIYRELAIWVLFAEIEIFSDNKNLWLSKANISS
jgi:hypothetical protein